MSKVANSNGFAVPADTSRTVASARSRSIDKSRLIDYLRTAPEKEDRHIKVIPNVLYKLVGSDHHAAAMLSQMLWWSGKTNNPDGWFYKTRQQWQDELFMTEWQVRKSLDLLSSLDFIETTQRKIYNVKTSHYRVLEGLLMNAIMEITEPGFEPEQINSPAPSGEILHSFTYTKGGEKGDSSAERIQPPEPRTETPADAGNEDSDSFAPLIEAGLMDKDKVEVRSELSQSGNTGTQRLIATKLKSPNRKKGGGKAKSSGQGRASSTLAAVWKESVAQSNESCHFVAPMTVADYSKLKHVEQVIAPDAEVKVLNGATMTDVLKDVLLRWSEFTCYVKVAKGLYLAPDIPQVGFFTANAGYAVNWWLKMKEYEDASRRSEVEWKRSKKAIALTIEQALEIADGITTSRI